MLGISSLAGWNAVLTTIDFFSKKYAKVNSNVGFLFPIPYMCAQFLFGLIMPKISEMFSATARILVGLISISVLMIILPIIALVAPDATGFYISMAGVLVLLGMANSLS